jgi:hypothetical protein
MVRLEALMEPHRDLQNFIEEEPIVRENWLEGL